MRSLIPWRWGQENREMTKLDNWMDRMWGSQFGDWPDIKSPFMAKIPILDVSEDKNEVTVRVELPGLTEKEIELTHANGILSIKGEKKEEKEEKKKNKHYQECRFGCFSRHIPIEQDVKWNLAAAQYKKGVLIVKLPKKKAATKKITVKTVTV